MNFLSSIGSFLRNKYFLALTFFVAWMLFFDRDDVFTQMERRTELSRIKTSKAYYANQIKQDRNFSKDLQFNASAIEKLAREKYLMKRDNEDLFLIQPLENK
jgi:cell division protein DivIC